MISLVNENEFQYFQFRNIYKKEKYTNLPNWLYITVYTCLCMYNKYVLIFELSVKF